MHKFYTFFSIFITLSFQLYIFKVIGIGSLTDTYFLTTSISQVVILLIVSSLQNAWLNSLIIDKSSKTLRNYSIESSQIIYLGILIHLSIIFILFFLGFYIYEIRFYFYFSILLLTSNFFQLSSYKLHLYYYSKNQHDYIEKIEFYSVFIYLISFIFLVYFKFYFFLPLPQLLKYLFHFFYLNKNEKLEIVYIYNFKIILSKPSSNLFYFFVLGSPVKLIPLIDRFIINSFGISYLSIFSICDSFISTLSRFVWHSFSFPKISKYIASNSGRDFRKIFVYMFISSITLTVLSYLFFSTLMFKELLFKLNYFKFNLYQFDFLFLVLSALLPTLYFTIPIGFIQNFIFSLKMEKKFINFNLFINIIFLLLKIYVAIFFSIYIFLVLIFFQKIVEYIIYYFLFKNNYSFNSIN